VPPFVGSCASADDDAAWLASCESNTVADIKAAQEDTETSLNQMSWERVFDFCERLHSQLAAGYAYEHDGETINITTKAQAQVFVDEEMQRLFDEEGFAYEFRDGAVESCADITANEDRQSIATMLALTMETLDMYPSLLG
jgi:hypothetical protein